MTTKTRVLFVCMGNICRSPLAEGVFRALVEADGHAALFEIDSAGTHHYHVGDPPDQRSVHVAKQHGVDIALLRGRQVATQDFEYYDYLLVMDDANMDRLQALCPKEHQPKLRYFLEFLPEDFVPEAFDPVSYKPYNPMLEVPDPYYGGPDGFEHIYQSIHQASQGFLQYILSHKAQTV